MDLRKQRAAIAVGIGAGFLYGIFARLAFLNTRFAIPFSLMTYGFIFVVPLAVGYLTVAPLESPGWPTRIFLPWLTSGLLLATAGLVGWEGSICLVMATPAVLVSSSVGGTLAGALAENARTRNAGAVAVLLLPFALGPVEDRLGAPRAEREVRTQIKIDAPREAVWDEIVEVPLIRPDEFRPRMVHRIGLPHPLAATLQGSGVGATREATFARGVRFVETIDEWQEGTSLGFTIQVEAESAYAFDEHVTIGGEYFDVLDGRYRIEVLETGGAVLHLASRYRLSTRFNVYAALWADHIMRSIQESILEVIKLRAELAARS
jgi:hypothetical protein